MDPGRFERFLKTQGRQDRRQTPRKHGLACARRPDHDRIVPTGGCDLQCPFDIFLALDLAEVEVSRRTTGKHRFTAVPVPAWLAAAGPVPAVPAPALRRPMAWAAAIAGVCMVIAVAAMLGIGQLASGLDGPNPHASWIGELLLLVIFSVATALSALGVGVVVSIEQRRSRRQLPPRPGPGGRALA